MKRNQLAAIRQIKQILNSKIHTFSEINEIMKKYCESCGLDFNIKYDVNDLFFDVLNIEIKDINGVYSDKDIDNGGYKRYLNCLYIVDSECISHKIKLAGAHNITAADTAKFSDFGITSENYSGSEKTIKNQVNKSQSWHIMRGNDLLLISYNTVIAYYNHERDCIYFTPTAFKHSATTNRHIGLFLQEFDKFTRKKFAGIGG